MIQEILLKGFESLRTENIRLSGIFERRMPMDSVVPVYLGIELPNNLIRFSFLITDDLKMKFDLSQSEGFEISVSEAKDQFGFYRVNVMLNDPSYYEIFLVLAADLVEILISAQNEKDAYQNFANRMEHWRDFLKYSKSRSLTYEEEIGLIGELVILEKLLTANSSIEVLSSWKGPLGKSHDFIKPGISFEIKTSPLKKKALVSISSEFQLDGLNLYLGHVIIDDSLNVSSSRSLPEIIDNLLTLIPDEGVSLFKGLILSAGYKEDEREKYKNRKYSLSSITFYDVTESFPKITPSSVNPQLSEIRYKLSIGGLATFIKPTDDLIGKMVEAHSGT